MKPSKSEGIAWGIVNIGLSLLMGMWLGFPAFLISLVVFYTIIGLLLNGANGEITLWNWFFDIMEISLPSKGE